MSPSLTAILKGCFGGWSTSTTSSMWIWWVLPFSELDIWRYGRTLFAIDCFLLFFSPWLILIRFDATDQSHLRKLQLPEIQCTNSCLKTNFQSGLLHEEEKGILVKKALAHICFLFLSLPMTWDLMHRCLLHLDLFKDMKIKFPERKISTKRWGKKTSSEDSFCKEKASPMRRLLPTFFAKSKTF